MATLTKKQTRQIDKLAFNATFKISEMSDVKGPERLIVKRQVRGYVAWLLFVKQMRPIYVTMKVARDYLGEEYDNVISSATYIEFSKEYGFYMSTEDMIKFYNEVYGYK